MGNCILSNRQDYYRQPIYNITSETYDKTPDTVRLTYIPQFNRTMLFVATATSTSSSTTESIALQVNSDSYTFVDGVSGAVTQLVGNYYNQSIKLHTKRSNEGGYAKWNLQIYLI